MGPNEKLSKFPELEKRLSKCQDYEIDLRLHIIHFKLVAVQINEEEILENLTNLKRFNMSRLVHCESINKDMFKLYFRPTKNIYHKYVIDIRDAERKIRVVTVHSINRNSQIRFEKYVRK